MNRVIGSDVQIEEFETLRKTVKKAYNWYEFVRIRPISRFCRFSTVCPIGQADGR
jgi:hypothetical protein